MKKQPKKKNNNALQIIFPYRERGTWMFDDESAGLVREPFVYGMDTMLSVMAGRMMGGKVKGLTKGVKLVFLHLPFPEAVELIWVREDVGGNWYRCPELDDRQGWLCPALFKYFEKAPPLLYVKMFPISAEESKNIHASPSLMNSILGTKVAQAIRNWRAGFCLGHDS